MHYLISIIKTQKKLARKTQFYINHAINLKNGLQRTLKLSKINFKMQHAVHYRIISSLDFYLLRTGIKRFTTNFDITVTIIFFISILLPDFGSGYSKWYISLIIQN